MRYLTCSELKRRQKERQKADSRAQKAATKATESPSEVKEASGSAAAAEEELDPAVSNLAPRFQLMIRNIMKCDTTPSKP